MAIGHGKEIYDFFEKTLWDKMPARDVLIDCLEDMEANRTGWSVEPGKSCEETCGHLRPAGVALQEAL